MTMVAEVFLWGRTIGAVTYDDRRRVAAFEYAPEFVRSGIEVAPLVMPLRNRVYEFPELSRQSFHGLPGLLADSLPDMFGNAVVDAWLTSQGRQPGSINPVERLCYTGSRGMGALEFAPALGPVSKGTRFVEIDNLSRLAHGVLQRRQDYAGMLLSDEEQQSLMELLRIGTSAGGARAKAVIAWNRTTGEIRSGQTDAEPNFEHWLLKFDGVVDPILTSGGYSPSHGAVEYAYSLMAGAAGISMTECRLHESNGQRHFMTRRFDRTQDGRKIHMQSLGALGHFDFNQPGTVSYEQAFTILHRLGIAMHDVEELFRRMVFNIVARNQDDHVKNIALLMNRTGAWSLAPAYDVTYSYNPDGAWTSQHQMLINGKRDQLAVSDIVASATSGLLKRGRAITILDEVVSAVRRWPEFATQAGVIDVIIAGIGKTHRTELPR